MKFSFAQANIKKTLLLPVYAVVGMVALVVPRDPQLWVFGRKSGFGEGPWRVLEEVRIHCPEARMVWIAQDDKDIELASNAGVECYRRTSWAAFRVTLRAAHIVVTHGLGDVVRPAALGGALIQLWHGTPLKRIGLDSPVTYRMGKGWLGRLSDWAILTLHRAAFRLPAAYIAASAISSQRLQSAFGVPAGKVLDIGDPRCDCLQMQDQLRERATARAQLTKLWGVADLPEKLWLYAPTWRDGDPDPGIPSIEELRKLAELCERGGGWLVIRSHPHGYGMEGLSGCAGTSAIFRFLTVDAVNDATPLLHAIDGLITDYSAIAMDYSLLERPIYFFAPDLKKYASERGLYEPYEQFTDGVWSSDWAGVAAAIERDARDAQSYRASCERSRAMKARYHRHVDGKAAERLVAHLASGS
jgi:CDP-glycerol glycerophosphotransferase (TagB/SpsB family)